MRGWPAVLAGVLAVASVAAALVPAGAPVPCDAAPALSAPVCGAWRPLPSLPSAREGLGLAVAPDGRAFAVGGRDAAGHAQGSLWMLAPGAAAWQALAPGPTRADMVVAWDDASQGLVLVGGRDDARSFADAWRYDALANAWGRLVTSAGPPAGYGAAGAFDPATRTLWAFGGGSETATSGDVWGLALATGQWVLGSNAPQGRIFAVAAWDAAHQGLLMHGGRSGGDLDDTWRYTPATDAWRALTPAPEPRSRAAGAATPQGTLLVAGGSDDGSALADAWGFAPPPDEAGGAIALPPAGAWVQQASMPAARAGAGSAWSGPCGCLVAAGGSDGKGPTAEVEAFHAGLGAP
jgi:hypothetical protein